MNTVLLEQLEHLAFNVRKDVVMTIINNGEGHMGPALSCVDILTVLYFAVMKIDLGDNSNPNNDKFILSAGHKCLAYYATLANKGIIDHQMLYSYNKLKSPLSGHPDMRKIPAIDFSTGSLGHGLSIGCGFALAAKLLNQDYKTFVLMGDGEQGEGSVWEAATFACHHKLDNLIALIDKNGLQVSGNTNDVMNTDSLKERYKTYGWEVRVVDGHNIGEIYNMFREIPFEEKKPSMIIYNTIKGKGLSFAENNHLYHHWDPDKTEAEKAISEMRGKAISRGWEF